MDLITPGVDISLVSVRTQSIRRRLPKFVLDYGDRSDSIDSISGSRDRGIRFCA
jgi:hypothetical protein